MVEQDDRRLGGRPLADPELATNPDIQNLPVRQWRSPSHHTVGLGGADGSRPVAHLPHDPGSRQQGDI
jgi:hypothetical protein